MPPGIRVDKADFTSRSCICLVEPYLPQRALFASTSLICLVEPFYLVQSPRPRRAPRSQFQGKSWSLHVEQALTSCYGQTRQLRHEEVASFFAAPRR
ncbi:hypothetical protein TIFTF001_025361 [Ficus carica]|uniref:Uncharacterized protein n=1 Tax=Ficus carica TaxID=3494 RepID=A0AA88AWN7_FICCA|nr:hypothetical protein TIFTF001_025361 [Ficus carica]